MVLAVASNQAHVSLEVFVATVGGLCLIIGYVANWLSPFARKHKKRVNKLDSMLDDWNGAPSRPGFDEIPSIPSRLKSIEDKNESREITQKVMEHNVSEINKSLNAAHRRLDDFGRRIEQEHGEKIAMLRQVQHDVTQLRMLTNYINLDRERKEVEWVTALRGQGLATPDARGVHPASVDSMPPSGEPI